MFSIRTLSLFYQLTNVDLMQRFLLWMSLALCSLSCFQSRNLILRFWSLTVLKTSLRTFYIKYWSSSTSRINWSLDFNYFWSLVLIHRFNDCLRTRWRNLLCVGRIFSLLISFVNVCWEVELLLLKLGIFIWQIGIF